MHLLIVPFPATSNQYPGLRRVSTCEVERIKNWDQLTWVPGEYIVKSQALCFGSGINYYGTQTRGRFFTFSCAGSNLLVPKKACEHVLAHPIANSTYSHGKNKHYRGVFWGHIHISLPEQVLCSNKWLFLYIYLSPNESDSSSITNFRMKRRSAKALASWRG